MKSELNPDFVGLFQQLPDRVKRTARKNYKLWQDNPSHPSLEFKEVNQEDQIWSISFELKWFFSLQLNEVTFIELKKCLNFKKKVKMLFDT